LHHFGSGKGSQLDDLPACLDAWMQRQLCATYFPWWCCYRTRAHTAVPVMLRPCMHQRTARQPSGCSGLDQMGDAWGAAWPCNRTAHKGIVARRVGKTGGRGYGCGLMFLEWALLMKSSASCCNAHAPDCTWTTAHKPAGMHQHIHVPYLGDSASEGCWDL